MLIDSTLELSIGDSELASQDCRNERPAPTLVKYMQANGGQQPVPAIPQPPHNKSVKIFALKTVQSH
jgi:hypothetical protein